MKALKGETTEDDRELLEKLRVKYSVQMERIPGVSPYKIPLWFKLVSRFKPPRAFTGTAMENMCNSYFQCKEVATGNKLWIVMLNASCN